MVELLVVIAIISLLAALLFPALKHARDSAKGIVCMNNLKNLSNAIVMYAGDNNDSLPSIQTANPWSLYYYHLSQGCLHPYLSRQAEDIVRCPMAKYAVGFGAFSYTMNYYAWGYLDTKPSVKMSAIARPADYICMADGVQLSPGNSCADWTYGPTVDGIPFRIGGIHNGGANVLFFDGHVERKLPATITDNMIVLP